MCDLRRFLIAVAVAGLLAATRGLHAQVPGEGSLDLHPDADTPAAVVAAPVTAAGEQIVQAVWVPQEFDFHYQSFTTFYSCTSLSEKVKRVLVALGVDPQLKVRVSGCDTSSGIARMPLVRIRMSAPAEATPEVLAELEKSRSRRELAARVRNDPTKDSEIDGQFPAQWTSVSLSRGTLGSESGDCDLIDQIKRKVLPRLSVRNVAGSLLCSPNQLSLGQPSLEVEALAAVPKADAVGAAKSRKDKT